MKKIILTIGICVASLIGVQAQQSSGNQPAQMADKYVQVLTKACDLTADQQAKVKPIVTEAISEKMANKQKYGTDNEKLEAANKTVNEQAKAKINAILTPDQQAKFVSFQNARKAAMQKQTTSSTGAQQK